MKKKMNRYTVYKTTNKVNGKIYVGEHTTTDPKDRYLGSGRIIKQAIEKYGEHSFSKEILFYAVSQDVAFLIESWVVDQEFIDRDDTYNIKLGGRNADMTDAIKQKIANTLTGSSCPHTAKRNKKNKGAKSTTAKLIRIYNANDDVMHVCFGNWNKTLKRNGYAHHSFYKALATGEPMYSKGNVPKGSAKYKGWRVEEDKIGTELLKILFRGVGETNHDDRSDYEKIIQICKHEIEKENDDKR